MLHRNWSWFLTERSFWLDLVQMSVNTGPHMWKEVNDLHYEKHCQVLRTGSFLRSFP